MKMDDYNEIFEFLRDIASSIGTTGMEYYSCRHGDKMFEYIKILEDRICEMENKENE